MFHYWIVDFVLSKRPVLDFLVLIFAFFLSFSCFLFVFLSSFFINSFFASFLCICFCSYFSFFFFLFLFRFSFCLSFSSHPIFFFSSFVFLSFLRSFIHLFLVFLSNFVWKESAANWPSSFVHLKFFNCQIIKTRLHFMNSLSPLLSTKGDISQL